jgi:hypothetical protein
MALDFLGGGPHHEDPACGARGGGRRLRYAERSLQRGGAPLRVGRPAPFALPKSHGREPSTETHAV